MNRNLISLTAAILLLTACRQQENASQLKTINQCLQNSNAVIQGDNGFYYEAMVTKLKDPLTSREAAIWALRTNEVKKQADSIKILIEDLKSKLLKQSDSLRKANAPIVEQLYKTKGEGYALLNMLTAFKESIPEIFNIKDFSDNPYQFNLIKEELAYMQDTIPLLPGFRDSLSETQRIIYKKKWVKENFAGSTSLLTMMQLNKIKSEVLVAERALVRYFLAKTELKVICGRPQPLAVINSSYIKSGQSIEVTAGMGLLKESDLRVIIDGKEIKLNSDFAAKYSFKATGKPGKHFIRLTYEYTQPDGSKATIWKNLEYIIAEN